MFDSLWITLFCLEYRFSKHKTGADARGRLERLPLPKTYESNFNHHDFVQFGKQHSPYKAILSSILLSQKCCEVACTVLHPSYSNEAVMRLNYQILLKSPPITLLAGSAPDTKWLYMLNILGGYGSLGSPWLRLRTTIFESMKFEAWFKYLSLFSVKLQPPKQLHTSLSKAEKRAKTSLWGSNHVTIF